MDGSALLSLVAVGMGVSFVPASARPRCPDDVALVAVPELTLGLTLEFVWRSGDDHPVLQRFIGVAKEVANLSSVDDQPQRAKRQPPDGVRERCP